MIAEAWLRIQLWMQRHRRDLLIHEQADFELRAHEAQVGRVDADRHIATLRRKLDRLRRGLPETVQ